MGHRVAFQTAQTELSSAILLWRERQCHQGADMGDAHCQPVTDAASERGDPRMEFFRPCDHRQNHADVLH